MQQYPVREQTFWQSTASGSSAHLSVSASSWQCDGRQNILTCNVLYLHDPLVYAALHLL